jgi:hypothetical protein
MRYGDLFSICYVKKPKHAVSDRRTLQLRQKHATHPGWAWPEATNGV